MCSFVTVSDFFFFKQKTAYEMRISDWSSDVCSSDQEKKMSVHSQARRVSVPQLMAYKGQQKIAALTAYTAPFARLLDDALDMILIGDSTAMVGYGLPNTLSITADQLAQHAADVVRSTGDRKRTRLNSSH